MREVTESIRRQRRQTYVLFAIALVCAVVAQRLQFASDDRTRELQRQTLGALDTARAEGLEALALVDTTRAEMHALVLEARAAHVARRRDFRDLEARLHGEILSLSRVADSVRIALPPPRRKR